MTKVLVWLDDLRDPWTGSWLADFAPISYDQVVWLKSAEEFYLYMQINGLPAAICFDHDLGLGPSGYDCATYVVYHCLDHKIPLPAWNIQSSNPVGKENIAGIFHSYNKYLSL